MKRLISAQTSDILAMDASALKKSIKASEGRVVLSENFAPRETFVGGEVTNSEIARAFGADMILLNGVDVFNPEIYGLDAEDSDFVGQLHKYVGRPIGVNLEPIDQSVAMLESRDELVRGRQANLDTIQHIEKSGLDFVCFTGNPGTGVSNKEIIASIELAKKHYTGLIIAGKMHGAGVSGPIVDMETVRSFIDAGADIILVPSIGSVPGFDAQNLKDVVQLAHENDTLVMTAIGTSQEGSDADMIRDMALQNKICGADIQHIGDAGYAGLAPVENIYALSKAIRGVRHAAGAMARSINR